FSTGPRPDPDLPMPGRPHPPLAADPRIAAALAARNTRLAPFWLQRRAPRAVAVPALTGRSALIVDAEDSFTGMLAHLFRELGLAVTIRPWQEAAGLSARPPAERGAAGNAREADLDARGWADGAGSAGGPVGTEFDLVVAGPGPGDPNDGADPKMATMRRVIADRLAARRPLLGVCLGHQLLAGLLGLRLHRRAAPYQGLARTIDLFGRPRRVGFYSTFTAIASSGDLPTAHGPVQLALDRGDGSVHALRGAAFAGVQFHPESVLSEDGLTVLRELLTELLAAAGAPADRAGETSLETAATPGGGAGTGLDE
uniref:aminodeoxychorismate/anthranilate synthase component II n=1 Tax=Frankia tisae TaxID=2950104 RepID=UPI0021C1CE57